MHAHTCTIYVCTLRSTSALNPALRGSSETDGHMRIDCVIESLTAK